jgi:hypothetical protein
MEARGHSLQTVLGWLSSGLLRRVVWWKLTDALNMEAVSISETSVHIYQTARRNNPEESHLHICRRENLKYYRAWNYVFYLKTWRNFLKGL